MNVPLTLKVTGCFTHMVVSGAVSTAKFLANPDPCVLFGAMDGFLEPAHDGMGWLAERGWAPPGYKGDAAKTIVTFPVTA
jgi:fatty-acyl-CoA synthase